MLFNIELLKEKKHFQGGRGEANGLWGCGNPRSFPPLNETLLLGVIFFSFLVA